MPVITCEAIDLRKKEPAVGIEVILRCTKPFAQLFHGITNKGGKVESWDSEEVYDQEMFQLKSPLTKI
jgi:hypothetical protein